LTRAFQGGCNRGADDARASRGFRRKNENRYGEVAMAVARVSKITASSTKSFQDAVNTGLARAAKTLRGITGLEVVSQKAKVVKGKIAEYRVTMEVTFVLEG
jgi:flavin-binding protein dodecin